MIEKPSPLICPECDKPMVHHADKPLEPRNEAEARRAGAEGVVVEEIHACPCGRIEARMA